MVLEFFSEKIRLVKESNNQGSSIVLTNPIPESMNFAVCVL